MNKKFFNFSIEILPNNISGNNNGTRNTYYNSTLSSSSTVNIIQPLFSNNEVNQTLYILNNQEIVLYLKELKI